VSCVPVFFLIWFSSGLEEGISSWKYAVGWLRRGPLLGKERGRNGKEGNGSRLLLVVANCWAREACWFFWRPNVGFFPAHSNKCNGATQASKLNKRPGFAERLQSLPAFARFTCWREFSTICVAGGLGKRTCVDLVSDPYAALKCESKRQCLYS